MVVERAVSSWSLHRTLGRFVAPDSGAHGGPFMAGAETDGGLALLDLPAELRKRGYSILQLVHFHLPSRDQAYLDELRAALAEAGVTLDALLIDDGDLAGGDGDAAESWIDEWLDAAEALGARRARMAAGRIAPTPDSLRESANRLVRLATGHPGIRVVTENWLAMLPDADTVLRLLDATGDSVGLLIDLGNWSGPGKYDELARIAPLAETCHAKCRFSETGPDREDFRRSLGVLKDAGFGGPLALIYDGPDGDEWSCLDIEYGIVNEVFGA